MSITEKYYHARTDEDSNRYREYLKKQIGCVFCQIPDSIYIKNVTEENESFWILKNEFPYAVYDGGKVVDHLMIVPKKHIEGISNLTEHEQKGLIELLIKYELLGYSFMARCPNDNGKTIAHQHTHLIKTTELK